MKRTNADCRTLRQSKAISSESLVAILAAYRDSLVTSEVESKRRFGRAP